MRQQILFRDLCLLCLLNQHLHRSRTTTLRAQTCLQAKDAKHLQTISPGLHCTRSGRVCMGRGSGERRVVVVRDLGVLCTCNVAVPWAASPCPSSTVSSCIVFVLWAALACPSYAPSSCICNVPVHWAASACPSSATNSCLRNVMP